MAELGRLVPPYGGISKCAATECETSDLSEEMGAYLFTDLETGKLLVFCGSCAAYVELNRSDRWKPVLL